jgi:hypothetical protein
MDTKIKKLIILIATTFSLISLYFIIKIVYKIFIIGYIITNYNVPGSFVTRVPSQIQGGIIEQLNDSLNKTNWIYNIPKGKDYGSQFWFINRYHFFFIATDTTKEEVFEVAFPAGLISIRAIFGVNYIIDNHKTISKEQKESYIDRFRVLLKSIEEEAKRRKIPDSLIYLPGPYQKYYGIDKKDD